MIDSQKNADPSNRGTVISVRSSVVDVRFSESLPPLGAGGALMVSKDGCEHVRAPTVLRVPEPRKRKRFFATLVMTKRVMQLRTL